MIFDLFHSSLQHGLCTESDSKLYLQGNYNGSVPMRVDIGSYECEKELDRCATFVSFSLLINPLPNWMIADKILQIKNGPCSCDHDDFLTLRINAPIMEFAHLIVWLLTCSYLANFILKSDNQKPPLQAPMSIIDFMKLAGGKTLNPLLILGTDGTVEGTTCMSVNDCTTFKVGAYLIRQISLSNQKIFDNNEQ